MKIKRSAQITQIAALVLMSSLLFSSCDRQIADLIDLQGYGAETAAAAPDTVTPADVTGAPDTASSETASPDGTEETGSETPAEDVTASGDETKAGEPLPDADQQQADGGYELPELEAGGQPEAVPSKAAPATMLPMILGYGVDYNCAHRFIFNQSYHNIFFVEKLIPLDKFEEWRQTPDEKSEDCDFSNKTIYEIIKYFDISRDDFTEWYYSTNNYYLCDFDIDILYSSDADTVETFYRSSGNYAEMMNRYGLLKIKLGLEALVGNEKYAGYLDAAQSDTANRENEWSIADFVLYFAVSEEQLSSVISSCIDEMAGREVSLNQSTTDGGRYLLPDAEYSESEYSDIFSRINFDRLFTEEGLEEVSAAIESGERPVLIDEMICSDIG